jgi:hypothetical protein
MRSVAHIGHVPKCAGCKGACNSRASKHVGWEERLERMVHTQSLEAARSACNSCTSKLHCMSHLSSSKHSCFLFLVLTKHNTLCVFLQATEKRQTPLFVAHVVPPLTSTNYKEYRSLYLTKLNSFFALKWQKNSSLSGFSFYS